MQVFASLMNLLHVPLLRPYFWFPNRQFSMGWGCQPYAQPPTWRTRSHIYNLWDWVAQLYLRHWIPILVTFYDMHGLQWDYSLIPVATRDEFIFIVFLNYVCFKISDRPIAPKKQKHEAAQKLKKAITKSVNEAMEDDLRAKALDGKKSLTPKKKASPAASRKGKRK